MGTIAVPIFICRAVCTQAILESAFGVVYEF